MALHIKHPKTDELAREITRLTGESITDAVTRALEERLARLRKADTIEQRRARIEKLLAEFDALPVLDDRSPDEILGYDENGLPT